MEEDGRKSRNQAWPTGGRASRSSEKAKARGDLELAKALLPPSERPVPESERCGALTGNMTYCKRKKGWQTDHPGFGNCKSHGGSTTAGKKAAMKEMGHSFVAEYKAQFRFGGNRQGEEFANLTPEEALLEEVRRSASMVRFLEERIALWNLTGEAMEKIEGFASAKGNSGDKLRTFREEALSELERATQISEEIPLPELTQVHAQTGVSSFTDAREWLYLYREERGHLARVSKMAIDAGVANRLVTLAEDQGRILSEALRAVLQALDLNPSQQSLIPQIVPPILRAVANNRKIPSITTLVDPHAAVPIAASVDE